MALKSSALLLLIAVPLTAQWLHYPTPGVPRTKDGKPNLTAPVPRLNGRPDLSGIWMLEGLPGNFEDYPAGPEFLNMGVKLPGGLPYLPAVAELVKQRSADRGKDDPVAFCKPAGVIRLLTFPPPRKILQLPGEIVVLSERDVTYWQIFTDGRPLPIDPTPTPNGFSVGKWEGDTLVVQTIGLRDGTWIDRAGSFITEAAKLTFRFKRVNFGRLEIDLTVDDPGAYTRPWTVKLVQEIVLDTELLDYHCSDNEKDASHAVGK